MFQTLSFCFRIGGPPPLIEEILWFGDIGLANLITQSRCDGIFSAMFYLPSQECHWTISPQPFCQRDVIGLSVDRGEH